MELCGGGRVAPLRVILTNEDLDVERACSQQAAASTSFRNLSRVSVPRVFPADPLPSAWIYYESLILLLISLWLCMKLLS